MTLRKLPVFKLLASRLAAFVRLGLDLFPETYHRYSLYCVYFILRIHLLGLCCNNFEVATVSLVMTVGRLFVRRMLGVLVAEENLRLDFNHLDDGLIRSFMSTLAFYLISTLFYIQDTLPWSRK